MSTMRLGVMAPLEKGPEATIKEVHDFGLPTCQVSCWERNLLNDEMADRLAAAAQEHDVEITTIWTGMKVPSGFAGRTGADWTGAANSKPSTWRPSNRGPTSPFA